MQSTRNGILAGARGRRPAPLAGHTIVDGSNPVSGRRSSDLQQSSYPLDHIPAASAAGRSYGLPGSAEVASESQLGEGLVRPLKRTSHRRRHQLADRRAVRWMRPARLRRLPEPHPPSRTDPGRPVSIDRSAAATGSPTRLRLANRPRWHLRGPDPPTSAAGLRFRGLPEGAHQFLSAGDDEGAGQCLA